MSVLKREFGSAPETLKVRERELTRAGFRSDPNQVFVRFHDAPSPSSYLIRCRDPARSFERKLLCIQYLQEETLNRRFCARMQAL